MNGISNSRGELERPFTGGTNPVTVISQTDISCSVTQRQHNILEEGPECPTLGKSTHVTGARFTP